MPVVVMPPTGNKKEIELKETYLDEDGQIKERIKKVNIPTFDSTEENDGSFNIFGEEE